MKPQKFYRLLIICLFFLISACSTIIKKPVLPAQPLAEDLQLQIIEKLSSGVKTAGLRALYNANLSNSSESAKFRYAVVTKRPYNFYLQVLPPNGFYALSLFKTDGNKALFIDNSNKRKVVGVSADQLVKKELGLNVQAQFLPSLFLGRLDLDTLGTEFKVYKINDSKLALVAKNFASYWEINSDSGLIERVQFWDSFSDTLSAQINYTAYQAVAGTLLPAKMVLTVPEYSVELTLGLVDAKLDAKIPTDFFTFLE